MYSMCVLYEFVVYTHVQYVCSTGVSCIYTCIVCVFDTSLLYTHVYSMYYVCLTRVSIKFNIFNLHNISIMALRNKIKNMK